MKLKIALDFSNALVNSFLFEKPTTTSGVIPPPSNTTLPFLVLKAVTVPSENFGTSPLLSLLA